MILPKLRDKTGLPTELRLRRELRYSDFLPCLIVIYVVRGDCRRIERGNSMPQNAMSAPPWDCGMRGKPSRIEMEIVSCDVACANFRHCLIRFTALLFSRKLQHFFAAGGKFEAEAKNLARLSHAL